MREGEGKSEGIELRVTPEELALLQRAADVKSKTLSDFLVDAGIKEAHDRLANRHLFPLDDHAWHTFQEMLDRPARDRPRLRKLLTEPNRQLG